jgi:glycerol-3-phosphate dehydrogenase (NAD(P)+)
MKITVLGEGAWGSAIALLLARNGHDVTLWCHHDSVAQDITKTRENKRFFPGFTFDRSIKVSADMTEALSSAQIIFEAVPVKYLRSTLVSIDNNYFNLPWVLLSKGIEQKTLLFPTHILDDVAQHPVQSAVLSGPSFARDVALCQPTAVTIATQDCLLGAKLYDIVKNDYFSPYVSRDVIGVQIGGALKNVLALGVGILEGAGYQDNARALFLTRGLQELALLAEKLGGSRDTLYGLSGMGDLILTAMGEQSRNTSLGRTLGSGVPLAQALQEREIAPEGINTAYVVHELLQREHIEAPLLDGIYRIISEDMTIQELFTQLMQQPFANECDLA